ncbi:MAG TPA: ester cyclase [Streptosporangiaceae bacterium]|nr:ester cyclase [Streptosporangiaceae bacterium]
MRSSWLRTYTRPPIPNVAAKTSPLKKMGERLVTDRELEEAASGFLDMAFNLGEPAAAVSEHLGGMFVQHNPQVADGAEAFIGFVNSMRSQFPGMHLEIKRVITQGKMVVTHSHLTLIPGKPGLALADFFRFEGDKVVEHWDVIQEIPDASANSNGMF